jgi:hypothetical protein
VRVIICEPRHPQDEPFHEVRKQDTQEPHVLATLNNTVVGLVLKHGYANLAQTRRVMDYPPNKCLHQLCFSWLP